MSLAPGRMPSTEQRLAKLEGERTRFEAALEALAGAQRDSARREAYMMQTLQELASRLLAIETRALVQADALRDAGDAIAGLTADTRTCPDTAERVAALAGDVQRSDEGLGALLKRVEERDAEIGKLRTAVTRLEHQAETQAEEARKGIAALLELLLARTGAGPGAG